MGTFIRQGIFIRVGVRQVVYVISQDVFLMSRQIPGEARNLEEVFWRET